MPEHTVKGDGQADRTANPGGERGRRSEPGGGAASGPGLSPLRQLVVDTLQALLLLALAAIGACLVTFAATTVAELIWAPPRTR